MRKRVEIPKDELLRLYYKENKSKYKIGKIYNCSFKTVLNRMRDYGMTPVSRSVIQSKYKKFDFSGDKQEKAYIIGFRIGDLNVYKTTARSEVVIVRCHTTVNDQLLVMENIFGQYGQISCAINKKTKSYAINCFLNSSFNFLVKKEDKVESWIDNDGKYSAAFAAGYVDAEGNIGIYDGRARFKIDSYDKNIISWYFKWFKRNDINCPHPKKIGCQGQVYNKENGYKYNKDLWRIRVSDKQSLRKLLIILKPYLRHAKRLNDLNKCLKNINVRSD